MRYSIFFFLLLFFCFLNPRDCDASESATVKRKIQRIVSLGPINTENVYLLGAGDLLVGTTVYCIRPEAAQNTEKIGSVMQVSVEKIIGLQPDLVLATGLTDPMQIKILRGAGLQVVHFDQPKSFEESCKHFEKLGAVLQREKEAQKITAELRLRVQKLAAMVARFKEKAPKVLLQVGANPLYVTGSDSFTNDFITLLGAKNAMGEKSSGRTNYEQVIAADPDFILIGMMGSETGVAADERKKWYKIKVIKAVQNGHIYVLDPDLVCSPSPDTFVQALEIISKLIYPQLIQ